MAEKSLAIQAVHKLREGKPLTPEEKKARDAYYRGYFEKAVRIYFDDPAELEKYKKMAQADGVKRFSRWLLAKVRLATTGRLVDADYVEDLKLQAKIWREKYEQERDHSESYRREAREMSQKYQDLAHKQNELIHAYNTLVKQLGGELGK